MLVDADELKRFGDLRLQLRVNGEVRQDMIVEGDILYPPVQALQALTKFQKLEAGDIVLTGTPVGTALTTHGIAPKGDIDILAFLSAQAEQPQPASRRRRGGHRGHRRRRHQPRTQRNKVVYA